MSRVRTAGSIALIAIGLLVTAIHAQNNAFLGNWKLNLAKSKYDPGPPPMSETRTYELWDKDGVKATFNRVDASGKHLTIGYEAHYDGKDYKYTGSPDFDTISLKQVDRNTIEAQNKKSGKVIQTTRAVVSADGKTRTLTTTGMNAAGQKVNNVVVFDRQ